MTTKTKTKTSITPAQARALRKWIVKDTDEGDRLDLVTCPICYEDSASLRGGQP